MTTTRTSTFSEIVVLQELDIETGLLVDVEYGVDFDGTLFKLGEFVNETYNKVWYATKGPSAVVADWSDDLILHQWKAGQKVRTEMVLKLPDIESTVYTIRAHFTIEHVANADGSGLIHEVYDGNVTEGLYADGPTDAYSAEINQLGMLLYGFNWDTKTSRPRRATTSSPSASRRTAGSRPRSRTSSASTVT